MHIPVLKEEVMRYLNPQANENFIDCTLGEAGHALAILEETGPEGKVLGIDQDQEILRNTRDKIQDTKYKDRLVLVCDNFVNLKKIVEKTGFKPVSGIVLDLGISSWHLDEAKRGFSFLKDEPLDMRFNKNDIGSIQNSKFKIDLTAREIVNFWSENEIERILRDYSQERFAKNIAKAIYEARKIKPIQTTFQLVEIVKRAVPRNYEGGRIHPATRTFLAIRIVVNRELENLTRVLPQALEALERNGRIAVISFHSSEDRIVKNFFKDRGKQGIIKILTKKPVTPTNKELKDNPSSRSAKLRAAEKQ